MTLSPESVSQVLRTSGIVLEEERLQLLSRYVALLAEWNLKINLISRVNENVWGAHILHCLGMLSLVELPSGIRALDIGTGGGLPGIPIAIARPDISFVLVDSIKKKIGAVDDMISQLGLSNVTAIQGRTEELKNRSDLKRSFDICTARAVAPLHELIAWSRPFVRRSQLPLRIRGSKETVPMPALIAMKGGDLAVEIESAKKKTSTNPVMLGIDFDGIETGGLEDKKLVLVSL